VAVALAWVAAGLVGIYSYLDNYYVHRGFAAPRRVARARSGRLVTVRFYSPAMRARSDYVVYLPAAYTPPRRYPAFYLLHGLPGDPMTYTRIGDIEVRVDNLIRERRMAPMILVFPDGRINGNWLTDSEWANTRTGRYESYVLDVVRDADRRFATLPERQARVIAGYSAGGYGALNITLHHLTVFGSAQVWSGYFVQTPTQVFFHATAAELYANSPLRYVPRLHSALRRYPLRVFMYVGANDTNRRKLARMAAELRAGGASVQYAIYPGGHDWQLWNGRMDQMLILAGQEVSQALARTAPRAHGSAPPRTPAAPQARETAPPRTPAPPGPHV
jgi:enterochelin esterase-like enzyme